jgi:osmotically-inducible protein OsmY
MRCKTIGRGSAILLVAVSMQTMLSAPVQSAPAIKKITDGGITFAVEQGLVSEKGVFPDFVDVSTTDGIVTLSGTVVDLLAKDRALKIAESIRGVRTVVDRLTVASQPRSDEAVRKDVASAFLQDPATESYRVTVSVRNAVATLAGSVGSYTEKQLVARIAKGVRGVKEVVNDVTVDYHAKRTDTEIAADVKSRLKWDIWIDGDLISSAVQAGKVTLSGTVGSAIGKSRAYDDAWVAGVASVDYSGLKVETWARDDTKRQMKYPIRSDEEIKNAVQAALRIDPRVSAFSPDVTVEGGIVILGGTVGNLKAKISAEQDVQNTAGALSVDNLLKVRPSGPSMDADTKKQLQAVLLWDPELDSSTVGVAVANHVVYLSGTVASNVQKAEAQDAASRTKGVVAVVNHLKVEPESFVSRNAWPDYLGYASPDYGQSPYYFSEAFGPQTFLSDERIGRSIEERLFWSPFVHGDNIKVSVDGGVATLTGTVGTWLGWAEADKAARRSGATTVRNRIRVK